MLGRPSAQKSKMSVCFSFYYKTMVLSREHRVKIPDAYGN